MFESLLTLIHTAKASNRPKSKCVTYMKVSFKPQCLINDKIRMGSAI